MSHEHAENLGTPDEILPPESLADLAQEAANTDREIPDTLGENLNDLVDLFDKLPEYTEEERTEIIAKLKADQKLRNKIGYSQAEFEKSIDEIANLIFEQVNTFKAIPQIIKTAQNPTEALKSIIKNPGKFVKLLQTLETSARVIVAVSNKEHLKDIPEEQRDLMTKIADKAIDFFNVIGFVNITAAKAYIAFMEKTGLSAGEKIDVKAFNTKRYSKEELAITHALISEMIDLKVKQIKIEDILNEEHDKEMNAANTDSEKKDAA